MYQLIYTSKAVRSISQNDITDILNVSTKNNHAKELTGCLVFIENTFIQILEGNQLKIESLYEKLLLDERHTDIQLISTGNSNQRFFPEWGMAYCPVFKKNTSEYDQFQRNLDMLLDLSQPSTKVEEQFWLMVKLKLSQNRSIHNLEIE